MKKRQEIAPPSEEKLADSLGFPQSLPEPPVYQYYADAAKRVFWLEGDIDDRASHIIKNIISINCEDTGLPCQERAPIRLMINTCGGDLDMTMALADAVELSDTPVICVNAGKALSGGFIVFLAGHRRLTLPHARFLYHDGSGVQGGTFAGMRQQMRVWEDEVRQMRDFVCQRSRITPQMLNRKVGSISGGLGGDWYITANEALRLGVADSIVVSLDELV